MVGMAIVFDEIVPRVLMAEGPGVIAASVLLLLLYIPAYLMRRSRWALHIFAGLATVGSIMFSFRLAIWSLETLGFSDSWAHIVLGIPTLAGVMTWRIIAAKSE